MELHEGLRRPLLLASLLICFAALRLLAAPAALAYCNPPELFIPLEYPLETSQPSMRDATTVAEVSRYTGTESPRLPDDTCPEGLYPGKNASNQNVCFDCGSDGFDLETNECVDCPANSFWGYGYCIVNCDPGEFFEFEGFKCVQNCPLNWIWAIPNCVSPPPASPPQWEMDLPNNRWLSVPDPGDGYTWDATLGKYRRCVGNEEYIESIGRCCLFESICENQGKAGEASLVSIPEGVTIHVTAVTGVVEWSDDGGQTWHPVQAGDSISGKLIRVSPGGSANWERTDNSSSSSFPGAPPGGYVQLMQGSVDIVQLGTCSATAARCGAHADAGSALLREDFSLGEYVALEAKIISPHWIRLHNRSQSGGSIDVRPGNPAGPGPVTSLQPGESVTFGAPPVPVARGPALLALAGLLSGLGIWLNRRSRHRE